MFLKEQENYQKLTKKLQEKLDELENLRKISASNSEESKQLETELSELNRVLGYTDVKGKGLSYYFYKMRMLLIMVTQNDNIIHDLDLVDIVNELFNAGAEAVSINSQKNYNFFIYKL